jgi:hypothetical protein
MLKYVEYMTAAAILVVVVGLFVLMFFYGLPTSTPQPPLQQQSEKHQVEKDSTEVEKTLWEKARTDPIALFTFWLVIFTAVLSGVGVIQLKLLGRSETIAANSARAARDSANAAKQSAEISEKTLVAANRPWIQLDVQVGGPITYDVNGANFTFRFILKNVGRSPATNVWVNLRVILNYPSDDPKAKGLDARQMLLKEISERKKQPPSPFGFAMFPDETIVQEVKTSVSKDELDRATKLIKAIYPTAYGSAEYRIGLDAAPHHTGFIFGVRRNDAPRPFTMQGKKWPAAIWIEEGDVPAGDVRLFRSLIEGGYAD